MNAFLRSTFPPGETPSGRVLVWFLIPFLAMLVIPLAALTRSGFAAVPVVIGLLAALAVVVAGLARGLPRWSLPSLGLAISLLRLLAFGFVMIPFMPMLMVWKGALWADMTRGRVLYGLILSFIQTLPAVLALVILAALALTLPSLSAFRQRLAKDWTLLPLLLYASNLLAPIYMDEYHPFELYEIAFAAVLMVGAWLYLRNSRSWVRLAILLAGTLLAQFVIALGVYVTYPSQPWVSQVEADFPRWWETLIPVLDAVGLIGMMGVAAGLGWMMRERSQAGANPS